MEHFEEIELDTADHKPAKWLRYFDNIFVVLSHGPTILQQFLRHLDSVRPTIKFTMEVEGNDTLPFLILVVMKRGLKLVTKFTGNLLILVVICTSSPATHIT
jgi:hypothetical protein